MNRTSNQRTLYEAELCNKHRQIRQIVSYLMKVIHIPDGDHLVQTFGVGHERTNREALIHWVEIHLDEIDPDDTEHRLRHLARQTNNGIEE